MDSDLHNLNGFLCGDESNNFPPTTQDHMSRKESFDVKPAEHLISPVSNHLEIKVFNMHSPSPLKQNFQFYDEDQSCSQDISEMVPLKLEKKCINQILSFGESPRRKASGCGTPSKLTTISVSSNNSNGIVLREEKRNTKGLKSLSECVYKIVLNLNVTTYKEVADELVSMFNKGEFGNCREAESKGKDEQNIKRRVYDALNVLIAAKVLKKNGKFVMSDEEVLPTEKIKFSKNLADDPENLNNELKKKAFIINEKKERIILLSNKLEILQVLMKKNCSSKSLKNKEPRVNFPIIGVEFSQEIPKIQKIDSNSKVIIPTKNIVQILGDLDLLMKSGIDKFSQDIEEVIGEISDEENSFDIMSKKNNKEH